MILSQVRHPEAADPAPLTCRLATCVASAARLKPGASGMG